MHTPETVKFYILVPTRERPDTLIHCLRTIINQNYENFEIIVSDNYSQDNTKQVVSSLGDKRISYVNTGRRISMAENFEHALSYVTNGWVTFLGDDDGLLPGALERIAKLIKDTGTEAVSSTWCHYIWPRVRGIDSILTIHYGHGWARRNTSEWLSKVMLGEANYSELPMLYTGGFVSTSAIDKARDHAHKFFKSLTPDVYSAIAISAVLDDYIHLNEPVVIAGTSAHSNGASCLGLVKDSTPADKFFSENTIEFHPTLAGQKIKSLPIIVYEAYLQSSFLHNNRFNTHLFDQLALAIAYAGGDQRPEIISYCEIAATKNNIEIEDILNQAKRIMATESRKARLSKLNRISTWFLRKRGDMWDADTLGVRNVFDASIAFKAILIAHESNRRWRSKKIIGALKRRGICNWI